jgi:hypothetical protein
VATLPCANNEKVVAQVRPTIRLLSNLDKLHPEVLHQHDIEPVDYHEGLVFRSAIESIRGSFIASSTPAREQLVGRVLEMLKQANDVADYRRSGTRERYDFEIAVTREPDYFAVIEVKGGEGNSVNISERPLSAREFAVWCHLDGAVTNHPAHGAHAIVNRLTNDLVRRDKQVDVIFFKDVLCGTRARPCPKYPGRETTIALGTAPDVFLLPTQRPTRFLPRPPVHSMTTLRLPATILRAFGVRDEHFHEHVWEVHVELIESRDKRLARKIEIWHRGEIVDRSVSRSWTS